MDSLILRKAAAKRRVERHDAVFTQPHHETGRVVSTESLSSTNNRRSGGISSPILGAICKLSCHRCHWAWVSSRLSSGGGGSRARIWVNSCCNHSCKTALGQVVTPLTRTFRGAGWN